jgi:uncharacterized protein YbbC (DUF1343 family)
MDLLKNKKLGIVTNNTAVLSNGVHLVDTLANIKGIHITALFGPEHGIRGDAPAGEKIESGTDPKTGIKVYSLYGKISKPTKEMLADIDLLIFDIQDIGARFYTYISTLYKVLQASAENNIPIIVLDRPNPIGGLYADGPIRKDSLSSFVGIAPIPVTHGMTVGELAKLFAGREYIGKGLKPALTVIKTENWKRNKYYDEYEFPWVSPSPNIANVEAELVYPGTCFIEGTNLSEGRGTQLPFLTIGAPFINSKELISELKKLKIKGAEFEAVSFTPVDIPGKAKDAKLKDSLCNGIKIKVTDRKEFQSVKFGIKLICALRKLYPSQLSIKAFFDKLTGDGKIKEMILAGEKPENIINYWQGELNDFKKIRKQYLIY